MDFSNSRDEQTSSCAVDDEQFSPGYMNGADMATPDTWSFGPDREWSARPWGCEPSLSSDEQLSAQLSEAGQSQLPAAGHDGKEGGSNTTALPDQVKEAEDVDDDMPVRADASVVVDRIEERPRAASSGVKGVEPFVNNENGMILCVGLMS
jgi:hypothetical protein